MLRTRRKKSFQFEALESRAMMAITTTFTNGNLQVLGDGIHDNIAITGDIATGRITVTGVSDSEGNPTLINGVANDSISFAPVYCNLIIGNNSGGGTDNSVTLDDVYLSGFLSVSCNGENTRIDIAGNAPVYAKGYLFVRTDASGTATINANNSTVYSLGEIELNIAGWELTQLDSRTIQGNANIIYRLNDSPGTMEATITNGWAGDDLSVSSTATNTNVYLSYSSARDRVSLYNYGGAESFWTVAYVFATTEFELSSGGIFGVTQNPGPGEPSGTPFFKPGNGTTNVHVQFCAAPTMKISGWGALNSTTMFSNAVGSMSVSHPANEGALDGGIMDLTYNVISGDLSAQMSSADDTMTLTGNNVTVSTTLSGGTGTNILKRLYNVFGSAPTITDFTEN